MKKLFIALLLIAILNESCATVYGGAITDCQRHRPKKGEPSRELRSGALTFDILGSIFLFGIPLIVDFATRAIYKPCPKEEKTKTPQPVILITNKEGEKAKKVNCNYIVKNVDKFTNQITYHTPYITNMGYDISIYSFILESDTLFYMNLSVDASTYNVNCKGVYIIFDDGSKWMFEKDEVKMDVSSYRNGYEAKASFPINKGDLKTLSEHRITDFKLYIYDTSISKRIGDQFKECSLCMLNL